MRGSHPAPKAYRQITCLDRAVLLKLTSPLRDDPRGEGISHHPDDARGNFPRREGACLAMPVLSAPRHRCEGRCALSPRRPAERTDPRRNGPPLPGPELKHPRAGEPVASFLLAHVPSSSCEQAAPPSSTLHDPRSMRSTPAAGRGSARHIKTPSACRPGRGASSADKSSAGPAHRRPRRASSDRETFPRPPLPALIR